MVVSVSQYSRGVLGACIPRSPANVEAVLHSHAYSHDKSCHHKIVVEPNMTNVCYATIEPERWSAFTIKIVPHVQRSHLSETAISDNVSSTPVVTKNIGWRDSFCDVMYAMMCNQEKSQAGIKS
jgi:hypothetical protein